LDALDLGQADQLIHREIGCFAASGVNTSTLFTATRTKAKAVPDVSEGTNWACVRALAVAIFQGLTYITLVAFRPKASSSWIT
jgi:heme/copper-type cytochrome/quinol oxidase subunit 3